MVRLAGSFGLRSFWGSLGVSLSLGGSWESLLGREPTAEEEGGVVEIFSVLRCSDFFCASSYHLIIGNAMHVCYLILCLTFFF
jgi:hypothetical protein